MILSSYPIHMSNSTVVDQTIVSILYQAQLIEPIVLYHGSWSNLYEFVKFPETDVKFHSLLIKLLFRITSIFVSNFVDQTIILYHGSWSNSHEFVKLLETYVKFHSLLIKLLFRCFAPPFSMVGHLVNIVPFYDHNLRHGCESMQHYVFLEVASHPCESFGFFTF